ncbi:MAG TPA: hypothetical protein DCZ94_19385 [Lentisphaeria bacterium]|nr:MAG: hypothetical protein A2X48_07530 [Lentisphaerae bacterium GWF2_49_21]HBC89107.1 hypothetical protein [Lentisphaeria bacterium]
MQSRLADLIYERSFAKANKLRWNAVTKSPLEHERKLCLRTPTDACGIVIQTDSRNANIQSAVADKSQTSSILEFYQLSNEFILMSGALA